MCVTLSVFVCVKYPVKANRAVRACEYLNKDYFSYVRNVWIRFFAGYLDYFFIPFKRDRFVTLIYTYTHIYILN